MFNGGNNGYSLADLAAVTRDGGFGGGWGGDGAWILILFVIFALGGWGGFGGFGGGFGGNMLWPMMMGGMGGGFGIDYLYPWLNNSENINGGFRDQQLSTQISGLRSDVTGGFADTALGIAGINQNLCQGFSGTAAAITGAQNALSTQMYNNEIASLNRSFDAQTSVNQGMNTIASGLQNCCCENRANIADLKYTVATENCQDRYEAANNTRDIIDSQTRGTQAILDKLCALELDSVKNQLAQAQRENVGLQNQLNMANLATSQTVQTAQILAGQSAEVDALYNRLNSCPVPTTPVYGRTPIFTCNNNGGCGCGGYGYNNLVA